MNSIFTKRHSPTPDPNKLPSGNTYNTVPTQSTEPDSSPPKNPPRPSSQPEPPEPTMTEDSTNKTPTLTYPNGLFSKNPQKARRIVDRSIYGQASSPEFIYLKPPTALPPPPTNHSLSPPKPNQTINQFLEKHVSENSNDNNQILEKYKALSGENTDSYFEPHLTSPVDVYDPTARDKNLEILEGLVDKTVNQKKLLISKFDMSLMNEQDVSSALEKIKADIRKNGSKGFGGLAESLHGDPSTTFSQTNFKKTGSELCDRQRTRINRYSRFKFMWF